MRITRSWLEEHIRLEDDVSVERLEQTLTRLGIEVKALIAPDEGLRPFVVARVLEAEKHPNADRLRVCLVDYGGSAPAQVVCGAPNARAGMVGVFAPPGTLIPGTGVQLEAAAIRGIDSSGMLLSERELGLSDEHDGIVELGADAGASGRPYLEAAARDETIFDLGLTPNRGDWFAVRGIARELAAGGCGSLKPMPAFTAETYGASPFGWYETLEGDERALAPAVRGRHFRIENNGASPQYVQRRLEAAGMRPISAAVDCTNYITLDLGRPLHVFDAAKLKGDLTIRRARDGESLEALDGETYRLTRDDLVIASGEHAESVEAIAGVMGGLASSVSETTREIVLEAALFDPISIAFTGRRLGIDSEARRRFERGVDPQAVEWGEAAGARLLLESCGGECSERIGFGAVPEPNRPIRFDPNRTASLGGVAVEIEEQVEALGALGIEVQRDERDGGALLCTPPSWRADLSGEACLVEEVLRIVGYDRIPTTPLPPAGARLRAAVAPPRARDARLRNLAAARGLSEHLGNSFTSEALARLFADDEGTREAALRLDNPISNDLGVMRPSLGASLVPAGIRNLARGRAEAALFEVGPVYRRGADGAHIQEQRFAVFRGGRAGARTWRTTARAADLFDVKADLAAALEALGAPLGGMRTAALANPPAWLHPARAGCITLGKTRIAVFGELHPQAGVALGLKGRAAAGELFLEALPPRRKRSGPAVANTGARLQPVSRDFAFTLDATIAAEDLLRAVSGSARDSITSARLFDVYCGTELGEGLKSCAVEVVFQPRERSFTEEELEALSLRVCQAAERAVGARLRGT